MIAGRELDALVAEKVMGWRRHSITVGGGPMSCAPGAINTRPHTLETADWLKEFNQKLNEHLERPEVKAKIEAEMRDAYFHYALWGEFPKPKSCP